MPTLPKTPEPSKINIKAHGTTVADPFRWIKTNKKFMKKFAKDNNTYTLDTLRLNKKSKPLFKSLVGDFKSRTSLQDTTIKSKYKSYHYYQTIQANDNYYKYYRIKSSKPQLLLDAQLLSKSYSYWSIGNIHHSPNEKYMAFTVDITGNEVYRLFIKTIGSPSSLEFDVVCNIYDSFLWSNNSHYIYFLKTDCTGRPYQLCIIDLHTRKEHILFTETNKEFTLSIQNTIDELFLVLYSANKQSNSVYIIDYNKDYQHINNLFTNNGKTLYQLDHNDTGFILHTNQDNSFNFKILQCDYIGQKKHNIIEHSNTRYLETFYLYKHFMVLVFIENAKNIISIYHFQSKKTVDIPTTGFFIRVPFALNMDYHANTIHYIESSYNQPKTIFAYQISNSIQKPVYTRTFKSYNTNHYKQTIITLPTTNIHLSIVYNIKKYTKNGTAPGLLSGYGAYGHANIMSFNKYVVSLLDRGYLYAIAHVRGGTENGYQWYEYGKMQYKQNSFNDFIDCMRYLKQNKWVDGSKLTILGGSAGGLLIGAVLNRPEIYREKLLANAVLDVPFVDALSTMLNPRIPLTKLEYTEWGNPTKDKQAFDYIRSYSPIQNISPTLQYPNMFIRCGLQDPRVGAWEAMKYIATLRSNKKTNNLLYTLQTGHFGSSKRFDYMNEQSFLYGFIILATNKQLTL
jgi:oligopeptidase B